MAAVRGEYTNLTTGAAKSFSVPFPSTPASPSASSMPSQNPHSESLRGLIVQLEQLRGMTNAYFSAQMNAPSAEADLEQEAFDEMNGEFLTLSLIMCLSFSILLLYF